MRNTGLAFRAAIFEAEFVVGIADVVLFEILCRRHFI